MEPSIKVKWIFCMCGILWYFLTTQQLNKTYALSVFLTFWIMNFLYIKKKSLVFYIAFIYLFTCLSTFLPFLPLFLSHPFFLLFSLPFSSSLSLYHSYDFRVVTKKPDEVLENMQIQFVVSYVANVL